MSVFEIIMLACFSLAWPVSIRRSYLSRTNKGKSVGLLWFIFFGYVSGVLHKLFYSHDAVIYLYCLNGVMVAVDIGLYYFNKFVPPAEPDGGSAPAHVE